MSPHVNIICPHCGQTLKVAGATAGKRLRCPQCQGFLHVADSPGLPPEMPPRSLVRTPEGQIYGPVSRGELEQWIREWRVSAACHIAPEGTEQWVPATDLFPHLTPPPRSAPAAPPFAQSHASSSSYPLGPVSERSRLVAGLLGLLLPLAGLHGIHRLYTGHIGLGILMLITCGGCGIWQLIDVILVFAGSVTDVDGRPLRE